MSEASEMGRLVGPFDAMVTELNAVGEGQATAILRNVGREPDSYRLSLEGGRGSVTPQSVELDQQQQIELHVQFIHGSDAELVVVSNGRGGEVVRVELDPPN